MAEPGTTPSEQPDTGPDEFENIVLRQSSGYRSMETMVYEILRESILTGVFAPGARLHQEPLARSIGVSRVPVRTALVQLESDGLVEFVPRRGAIVATLNAREVSEIYEIREMLETAALRKGAALHDESRIARLRELAARVDDKDEAMTFVEARKEFYRLLYDDETNPYLYHLIEDLRLKSSRYLLSHPANTPHEHSHSDIVDLLARGEVDDAVEALRLHLRRSRDAVLGLVGGETGAPSPG